MTVSKVNMNSYCLFYWKTLQTINYKLIYLRHFTLTFIGFFCSAAAGYFYFIQHWWELTWSRSTLKQSNAFKQSTIKVKRRISISFTFNSCIRTWIIEIVLTESKNHILSSNKFWYKFCLKLEFIRNCIRLRHWDSPPSHCLSPAPSVTRSDCCRQSGAIGVIGVAPSLLIYFSLLPTGPRNQTMQTIWDRH